MNIYDSTDKRLRRFYRLKDRYYYLVDVASNGRARLLWRRYSREDISAIVPNGMMESIPKFTDENQVEYYRARALEDANNKTNENLTKKTALEAMTKAELVATVQQLMHEKNVLETDKERVKEEYNVVANERSKLHTHLNAARADAESWKSMATNLERECKEHKEQVRLVQEDREALSEQLEASRANAEQLRKQRDRAESKTRDMEKRFLKQAELAGEVAKLNPYNH